MDTIKFLAPIFFMFCLTQKCITLLKLNELQMAFHVDFKVALSVHLLSGP